MRAAILEGDKLARLGTKEDDRLAEKCPPAQLPTELVRKSGRVPASVRNIVTSETYGDIIDA
jgi:hypothetical protein